MMSRKEEEMSFTQTLILTQAYRPHEITDWKDAVTRMFGGKIEVLAQYDEILAVVGKRTLEAFPELRAALRQVLGTDPESITLKIPAVAVLRRPVRKMKQGVKFSKTNLCVRDSFSCQYCGDRLPMSQLNYDHVMPKSRGGKTVWDNVSMSCFGCNNKKANRTPEEAGMPLLTVPREPRELPLVGPQLEPEKCPEEWRPFLVA